MAVLDWLRLRDALLRLLAVPANDRPAYQTILSTLAADAPVAFATMLRFLKDSDPNSVARMLILYTGAGSEHHEWIHGLIARAFDVARHSVSDTKAGDDKNSA